MDLVFVIDLSNDDFENDTIIENWLSLNEIIFLFASQWTNNISQFSNVNVAFRVAIISFNDENVTLHVNLNDFDDLSYNQNNFESIEQVIKIIQNLKFSTTSTTTTNDSISLLDEAIQAVITQVFAPTEQQQKNRELITLVMTDYNEIQVMNEYDDTQSICQWLTQTNTTSNNSASTSSRYTNYLQSHSQTYFTIYDRFNQIGNILNESQFSSISCLYNEVFTSDESITVVTDLFGNGINDNSSIQTYVNVIVSQYCDCGCLGCNFALHDELSVLNSHLYSFENVSLTIQDSLDVFYGWIITTSDTLPNQFVMTSIDVKFYGLDIQRHRLQIMIHDITDNIENFTVTDKFNISDVFVGNGLYSIDLPTTEEHYWEKSHTYALQVFIDGFESNDALTVTTVAITNFDNVLLYNPLSYNFFSLIESTNWLQETIFLDYREYDIEQTFSIFGQFCIKCIVDQFPTLYPTISPTNIPTFPTNQPSNIPTREPIISPTYMPSNIPSAVPSLQPSDEPSDRPSSQPSSQPSDQPSDAPSHQPSVDPSNIPSQMPSALPTTNPTNEPTSYPTRNPTEIPTFNPTERPSESPTHNPTYKPTRVPTADPSSYPTRFPSNNPS